MNEVPSIGTAFGLLSGASPEKEEGVISTLINWFRFSAQERLDMKLFEAASEGDLPGVKRWHKAGANIHAAYNRTLKNAIEADAADCVEYLCQRGANIHDKYELSGNLPGNYRTYDSMSALELADTLKDREAIRSLLPEPQDVTASRLQLAKPFIPD